MLSSTASGAGSPWVCVDVFRIEKRGVSIRRRIKDSRWHPSYVPAFHSRWGFGLV